MKKLLSLILSILIIASMFAGCAANESAPADSDRYFDSMNSTQGSVSMDKGGYGGIYDEESSIEPESPNMSDATSDTDLYLNNQKLIYSCNIEMETLTFVDAVAEIKAMIRQYEGFVESDSMSDDSWNWYYEDYKKNGGTLKERIVIRIPTEHYSNFVNALGESGKIMNKSERVTNITKSYNETSTIIKMLEQEEKTLLEMLGRCNTIQEMLSVESRLSEVQRKLAIYKNELGNMDIDIAFSTITIQIREVMEYTRVVENELTFFERFVEAIDDSCESFLDVLSNCVIAFVYMAPYIVGGLIVFVVIRVVIKKKRKTKNCSRETMQITGNSTNENKSHDESLGNQSDNGKTTS
jgi:hypothetical protein